MTISEADIILEGSLKRCKRYKLFKTKWVDRHFVLYCRDRSRRLYTIDEYKTSEKTDLKKQFNLDYVNRVESNLSFSDPSISCSSFTHDASIDWIFAIGFRVDNIQKDLYLVAKNETEMSSWVSQICKLCKLRRQNEDIAMQEGDISQAAESSISGISMSSQSLDMSIIEQQQYAENQENNAPASESEDRMGLFNFGGIKSTSTRARQHSVRRASTVERYGGRAYSSVPNTPSDDHNNFFVQYDLVHGAGEMPTQRELAEPHKYLRMQHFKSVNSHQSIPRDSNPNYNNLPEPLDTRSDTSSIYSSRRTEDDSLSYTSGPPIPPPRARHSANRYAKNSMTSRLHMVPASTSMGQVVKADAEDSSGETLKDVPPETYPESVTSSEGISVYERNGRTLIRRAPPPIDRSNKPKNLRGEEDGAWYRNLGKNSNNENGNYSAHYSRTPNYQQNDHSKRRNLDYFEPQQLVDNSSSSTVAASTRSPTPSDIEYISVDVDRTLAFKQMRRTAPSGD